MVGDKTMSKTQRQFIRKARSKALNKVLGHVIWNDFGYQNRYWNRDTVAVVCGYKCLDKRVMEDIQYQVDMALDQMGLYGFKDGMSSREINKEVSQNEKSIKRVLNKKESNIGFDENTCWFAEWYVIDRIDSFIIDESENMQHQKICDSFKNAQAFIKDQYREEYSEFIVDVELSKYVKFYLIDNDHGVLTIISPVSK